jgi:hypothetical protein
MQSSTPNGNKERKREIEQKYKICGFCPYHRNENKRRTQRTDKYKSQRKGKV